MKINPREVVLKNNSKIILRSVVPTEAREMLDHLIISHGESYRNLNRGPAYWKAMPVENEMEILEDFESSPSKFMIAAIHEKKIVGALGFVGASGEFNSKNGSLGMSIQNGFSGLGLGTHLLELAIESAKAEGFHRMDLTVRTYNSRAISLYERMGFERIGRLKEVALIDGSYVDEFAYQRII